LFFTRRPIENWKRQNGEWSISNKIVKKNTPRRRKNSTSRVSYDTYKRLATRPRRRHASIRTEIIAFAPVACKYNCAHFKFGLDHGAGVVRVQRVERLPHAVGDVLQQRGHHNVAVVRRKKPPETEKRSRYATVWTFNGRELGVVVRAIRFRFYILVWKIY